MNSDQTYQDYITDIVTNLSLQPSPDGIFYGEVGSTPITLSLLTDFPPSVMFKAPISSERSGAPKWSDRIEELRTKDLIEIDYHNNYIFLSFDDLSSISSRELLSLLEDFFHSLREVGCFDEPSCSSCGTEEDIEIVCSAQYAKWICSECLSDKQEEASSTEATLNKTNANWSLLLPFTLILGAAGWLLFWIGYEQVFITTNQ